jgi:hypothetical protein
MKLSELVSIAGSEEKSDKFCVFLRWQINRQSEKEIFQMLCYNCRRVVVSTHKIYTLMVNRRFHELQPL